MKALSPAFVTEDIRQGPRLRVDRLWLWFWLFLIFYTTLVLLWSLLPESLQEIGFLSVATTCIVLFMLFPAPVSLRARLLGLIVWLLGVYVMIMILPQPPTVDARSKYYAMFEMFSASDLITQLFSSFDLETTLVYSPFTLSLILKPLLGNFTSLGPWAVALPYGVLWILSSFVWVQALYRKREEEPLFGDNSFTALLFVALMALPSVAYWSMSFMKEVPFVAVNVFSAVRFSQRKYFSAILLLIVVSLIRPYAVGIVASYWLFLQPSQKLRWMTALGSAALFFAFTRANIIAIPKFALLTVYTFISPDPVDPNNWQLVSIDDFGSATPTLFLTLEGILLGTLLLVGIVALIASVKRRTWLRLGLSILVGCAVLGVVDHFYSVNRLGSYSLFAFGAPAMRLKFTLWPLIVTWGAVALKAVKVGEKRHELGAIVGEKSA